ncbi:tetraacyldisaccharide 4'-kinase [Thermosulfurimonas marina]|uniref:Tetraacyldisaccharide 4'-kinase n=1 Tax=Thermosulfurimonas marina TaxID=2047767 RepID=A0A6H1WTZ7_9BACT|nr:tetraacyldisaccharide 4'-kinase [Thermosulfurimonas marina]QJA06683.1 tetraacyldisaccharide 4'-kinase [Thermosulfurimonas marina]
MNPSLENLWEISRPLWRPLSWVYGMAVRLRRRAYERGWLARRHPGVFSLVVGNLSLGGEGKTPVTLALAEWLWALGRRPVVILRGYGGRGRGPLVVSEGGGSRVSPEVSGDEAQLYAQRLSGVPVVVGRDRLAASELACRRFRPGVLLFDDAFQHLRLSADLYLLVVSAARDPFSEPLFPAGRLREPPGAACRASAILLTRTEDYPERAEALFRRFSEMGLPVFSVTLEPGPLVGRFPQGLFPVSGLRPRRVVAFCGVGDPESFRRALGARGFEVLHLESFPDHYSYRPRDLKRLYRKAQELSAEALLTTEKDLVKIPPVAGPLPLLALSLLTRLPRAFLRWLEEQLPPAEG